MRSFKGPGFILVILDNATTAMTGHQPTPQVGLTAAGEPGHPVFIPELVRACGVDFLKECDPYEVLEFMRGLKGSRPLLPQRSRRAGGGHRQTRLHAGPGSPQVPGGL